MIHPSSQSDSALLAACDFERGRRSGPGGQHRNKVETHVTLTHRATGVSAQAGERRAQAENKRVALRRLRLALALAVRESASEPSPLWKSRCRDGRIACNPEHADFPGLLAEALDQVLAADLEPAEAAQRLGCSTSQLIKLVQKHPPAMVWWNEARAQRGLRKLH